MKLGKLGKTGKFTGDWKSHEKLENSWQLVQILSRKTGTLMIWKTESSRKVKKNKKKTNNNNNKTNNSKQELWKTRKVMVKVEKSLTTG